MVRSNLKVLAKFDPCSNCSLVRARKIFATACMLGFSLKFPALSGKHNLLLETMFPVWESGKHCGGNLMCELLERLPGFVDVY